MKNDTFKTMLIAIVITVFFSTSSFAQAQNRQERREPPTFEELIEQMDANEDGKLAKDEIKGRLKSEFDNIDTDENGFITAKEFEKAPKPERRPKRQ